jgi:hypothetical protein
MSAEIEKNVTKKRKKMNYLGEMVPDRQNLSAFTEEMDILHRFLQFLILGGKIDSHDMFFHST